MPIFRYQALNAQREPVTGEVQADGVQQAISQLEAGGLSVLSIGHASAESTSRQRPPAKSSGASQRPAASSKLDVELTVLHSHLHHVIQRGKSLVPALCAYAEEMPSDRGRRQLQSVCSILEHGDATAATAALAALPEYWIPLLSAAVSSNDPGRVLREFLEESQRAVDLRRQWWATLAYPLIVAGIATAVLTGLSFFVIPTFRDVFGDFQLALPALTRWVLNVALWITSGRAVLVVVALAVVAILLRKAYRVLPESLAAWLSNTFGMLLGRSTAIAQFARLTADLLEAGVDVPNALRIGGFATKRLSLQRAGWRLANAIESGSDRDIQACRRTLTTSLIHALQSEMPSASRVRLLKELSCCHAERARHRLSWTRGMIEPITIGLVGVLVGAMVIGLFVPLVTLVSALSG